MKRSTERILTTHTGSLPRPEELMRVMFAKEEGVPVDAAALAARIRAAVADVVGKQVAAGIDVVNDGEYSKPSYATYVKDRLAGFGGASHPLQYRDLVDFLTLHAVEGIVVHRCLVAPLVANGLEPGMIVDAELLCTVIATMGTKSFKVLIFIFALLFSKNFVTATDSATKIANVDIFLCFR